MSEHPPRFRPYHNFFAQQSEDEEQSSPRPTTRQTKRHCRRCGLYFDLLQHLLLHFNSARHLAGRRTKFDTESEAETIETGMKRRAEYLLPEEPIRKIRRLAAQKQYLNNEQTTCLLGQLPDSIKLGYTPTEYSNTTDNYLLSPSQQVYHYIQ